MDARLQDVLKFWFEDHGPADWFQKDSDFDEIIRARFGDFLKQLKADPDLAISSAQTALESLAIVIVLDQFSRNLYRGSVEAFSADPLARDIGRQAIARGYHISDDLPPMGPLFLFLPFEHSESLADQEWCCTLVETLDNEDFLDFAIKHRTIIQQFGRFPHRNGILGRVSTQEEVAFLKLPGYSF